ncbi:PREDICTED: uncharacterized protein LOC106742080 [Dinoponera quadriceps]|uniref:Uncharacterized protein LOC106742080 n=1 Tax=Dinoponera quadriceps TaxID=609295 RepID=A0A6P3WVJ4_DINQU|nr:PREDICTED: uncharacterized protein LOC106742080 [Dinoponera quadriceps]
MHDLGHHKPATEPPRRICCALDRQTCDTPFLRTLSRSSPLNERDRSCLELVRKYLIVSFATCSTRISPTIFHPLEYKIMASKVVVFMLLLVGCSYALPLRATIYGSPLLVVPVVEDLEEPRAYEEAMYTLNDNPSSFDIVKRSVQEASDDDDDLETAAGSNVLRPLFVYRQQIAYRQRAREAFRRGRRI